MFHIGFFYFSTESQQHARLMFPTEDISFQETLDDAESDILTEEVLDFDIVVVDLNHSRKSVKHIITLCKNKFPKARLYISAESRQIGDLLKEIEKTPHACTYIPRNFLDIYCFVRQGLFEKCIEMEYLPFSIVLTEIARQIDHDMAVEKREGLGRGGNGTDEFLHVNEVKNLSNLVQRMGSKKLNQIIDDIAIHFQGNPYQSLNLSELYFFFRLHCVEGAKNFPKLRSETVPSPNIVNTPVTFTNLIKASWFHFFKLDINPIMIQKCFFGILFQGLGLEIKHRYFQKVKLKEMSMKEKKLYLGYPIESIRILQDHYDVTDPTINQMIQRSVGYLVDEHTGGIKRMQFPSDRPELAVVYVTNVLFDVLRDMFSLDQALSSNLIDLESKLLKFNIHPQIAGSLLEFARCLFEFKKQVKRSA